MCETTYKEVATIFRNPQNQATYLQDSGKWSHKGKEVVEEWKRHIHGDQ